MLKISMRTPISFNDENQSINCHPNLSQHQQPQHLALTISCEDLDTKEGEIIVMESTSPARPVASILERNTTVPINTNTDFLATATTTIAFKSSTTARQVCSTNNNKPRLDILLQANLITMLGFSQIARLGEVSKDVLRLIRTKPQTMAYWRSMCVSLCSLKKIFTPLIHDLSYLGKNQRITDAEAKKLFHTDLWPSRRKWSLSAEAETKQLQEEESQNDTEFKIRVACRFRPGERKAKDMQLPLHQVRY